LQYLNLLQSKPQRGTRERAEDFTSRHGYPDPHRDCVFVCAGSWAKPIATYVARDSRAALAIVAVSPAVLVLSVLQHFGFLSRSTEHGAQRLVTGDRASNQGHCHDRTGMGVLASWVEYAAAGANLGAVLGGTAGLFALIIAYLRQEHERGSWRTAWSATGGEEGLQPAGELISGSRDNYMASRLSLIRKIFELSFPVVLAAAIMPLMQFLDIGIVPLRLSHAGFRRMKSLSFSDG